MAASAIGQLLGRLLRQFRAELFAPAAQRGYRDLREPHLQIFGNLGVDGVRLTDLAARAQLSLAATSELVNDLQRLGYLERRPDPPTGGPSSSSRPGATARTRPLRRHLPRPPAAAGPTLRRTTDRGTLTSPHATHMLRPL
jgi:hypothetical protein